MQRIFFIDDGLLELSSDKVRSFLFSGMEIPESHQEMGVYYCSYTNPANHDQYRKNHGSISQLGEIVKSLDWKKTLELRIVTEMDEYICSLLPDPDAIPEEMCKLIDF